ncbi:hypothetical protein BD324DRAFT_652578 [Kockovaella imperatae]|uniref:PHD-type domain-containing protein n=1 Tax=Kockovaella imperatae TaxID=4999 RepID=A0A1Y1UBM7_9TREE|nr:hypothetical protein BD324DRAFT_652578 [Kockovaella imperatae]ORX35450.1 hypothetical protein BD324DRAFT_652578 [Kockovaella imperatae]
MPRRVVPPEEAAVLNPTAPPPPPSPIVQKLRTDWRWAAISQFLWTFSDAFGLVDWDIENLERDFDGDETALIPDLLAKLLYALTYNRQINSSNAFEHLHKQYLKRFPENSPFGSLEEPVEWATLGLGRKVQTIWELCEWQLHDAAKFRALLPNEDEATSWRIDPLGWDKAGNTYWLFDDNRLWIQRLPPPPPRPPKKSSLKAKRALKRSRPSDKSKQSRKKRVESDPPTPPPAKIEEPVSGPRKRTQVQFFGNVTPTVQALKRGGVKETPPSTRGTRSSHILNGEPEAGPSTAPISTPSKTRGKSTPVKVEKVETPLPRGTRVSRRLRNVDDEWQQVPDEWLQEGAESSQASIKVNRNNKGKGKGTGKGKTKADDEESELSELTDEDEHQARLEASQGHRSSPVEQGLKANGEESEQLTPLPMSDEPEQHQPDGDGTKIEHDSAEEQDVTMGGDETKTETGGDGDIEMRPKSEEQAENEDAEDDDETDEVKLVAKEADNLPDGFVEWETVCVTLYDWKTYPEQFKESKDPDEKALYVMLADHVGPTVIEALVAKEQERLKQEAINNRKRSSRILARDLEKEEIAKREKAQREMEERMEKQRKEEDRIAKEEADLLARERAREERLREREERAAAREGAAMARVVADQEAKEQAIQERENRKRRRELGLDEVEGSSREGSRALTPSRNKIASNGDAGQKKADDSWELNCEVCRKQGWNIDEDEDIVCCDDCGRWQHVECHNRLDIAEGRPIRNWDSVDFKCKDCRRRAARKRQRMEEEAREATRGSAGAPGPPPPPLQPGQYYLPYPPQGQHAVPPVGYAVYYNGPDGPSSAPQPMMPYQARPPHPSQQNLQPRPQLSGKAQPTMDGRPAAAHGQHPQYRPGPSGTPQTQHVQQPHTIGQTSVSPQSRPPTMHNGHPPHAVPLRQGILPHSQHAANGSPHGLAIPHQSRGHQAQHPLQQQVHHPSPPGQTNAINSPSPLARPMVIHGTVPHAAQHPFAPQQGRSNGPSAQPITHPHQPPASLPYSGPMTSQAPPGWRPPAPGHAQGPQPSAASQAHPSADHMLSQQQQQRQAASGGPPPGSMFPPQPHVPKPQQSRPQASPSQAHGPGQPFSSGPAHHQAGDPHQGRPVDAMEQVSRQGSFPGPSGTAEAAQNGSSTPQPSGTQKAQQLPTVQQPTSYPNGHQQNGAPSVSSGPGGSLSPSAASKVSMTALTDPPNTR